MPAWDAALEWAGRWADEADHLHTLGDDPAPGAPPAGVAASTWAMLKTGVTVLGAPMSIPAMAVASRRAQRIALDRIARFDEHLHALAEGRETPLPAPRRGRVASDRRIVITSDLHRCIPGRLDWPARQRTKELTLRVLTRYAEDGWDLIENGDVEDFWMVGGSTWGVVYDVAGLAELAAGHLLPGPAGPVHGQHLERIVENNAETYRVLREGFCSDGRYHRTMGNHDDVFTDAAMERRLAEHLPGTSVVDTILLDRPGATARDGIDGVAAMISHGHLTDSWNGPGFSLLGRLVTWMATTLDDLPRGTRAQRYDGLPDETSVGELLAGRGRNRLITIDPRFGGNRRFDSLDEEHLFGRLAEVEPDGGWPWLLHGHTHYPMLRPQTFDGREVRYANSGTGVLRGAFTALEWDGDRPEDPLRLVMWRATASGPAERVELVPDGRYLRPA